MINKKGLWFLTLFSLILVLSVYYITMPDDMFKASKEDTQVQEVSKEETNKTNTNVEELTTIEILKQELNDERQKNIDTLEEKIKNSESTSEEKNQAYETIKEINKNKSIEDSLEEKIKNKLELTSFVQIDNDNVTVVISKKDHNIELANEVMNVVQEEFDNQISVSVKFQE